MPESKTVTGHAVVMVKLAEKGAEAIVKRGESLPEDLAEGELARLEKIGAFAEAPRADLAAQGARPTFAAVPEVRQVTTDALPPRGDLAGLPLPPQVTLNANPEPEGAKATGTEDEGAKDEPAKETAGRRSAQR